MGPLPNLPLSPKASLHPQRADTSPQKIAANAASLHVNPSKGFLVHGESAGGNMATVITLLARDEKLSPPVTGLSASAPAVLSPEVVPERFKAEYLSVEQNKEAPGLDRTSIDLLLCEWFSKGGTSGGLCCMSVYVC